MLSTCRFLCGVNVVLSFFVVGVCVIGIVLYALFHFLALCSLFLLILDGSCVVSLFVILLFL